MGLGVTRLLSQVVKLERDLVVRVKEAAITQVSVLRYQDLQEKQTVKRSVNIAVLHRHCLNHFRNANDLMIR